METPKSTSKSLAARLHPFRSARAGAFTTFLLLPMALPVCAQRIWDGGGTTDDWTDAANWDAPLVAGQTITFAGSTRLSPNLPASIIVGGITFDAAAGAFTVGGDRIEMNAAGIGFLGNPTNPITQTINNDILLRSGLNGSTLTVTTQTNGAITLGGAIGDGGTAGNRGITKAGDGTLTLDGLSNFSGQVRINQGIVNANTIANAGTLSSLGRGNAATGNPVTPVASAPIIRMGNAGTIGTLVFTGTTSVGTTNRQVQVGNNTAAGSGGPQATDTGGATIANNKTSATDTLVFSNPAFNAANSAAIAARALTLGGSNTGPNTISGAIVDNVAVTAKINLVKADAGTWVLGGANTYTGTTTVSNGTLRVNGSLGDTTVTVAGAATLGGSGTVGTSAVLNILTVNGTLAPGNSTGTLTVNDNLDLTGTLSMEVIGTTAGTGYDQVAVNGAVDIAGSTLTTSFNTFTPLDGNLLFILVNDGTDAITGTFTGLSQDAVVANYRGFDWKISYTANSAGNAFTGGNDIALMAVPDGSVILSSWTFDSGATPNARLASSATASGLTVSELNLHPTFDMLPTLVNNNPAPLIALSTHDRWAADSGIGIIRMRRADYTSAPSGRSATFNSTNTSISSAAGTLGAPVWFSVTTDSLTEATIRRISITNPGGSDATTYYFSKSGDPLGTGVSDAQPTIFLAAPITLAANETVFFCINMDSAAVASNHNINRIDLKGTTVALPPPPPPIGLVTSRLTIGGPFGANNRLSCTLAPDGATASTRTSDLSGGMDVTVNIDPLTGKTALLTLSAGRVNGTDMNFSAFGYNITAANLEAEIKTITPPGSVNANTGVFAATQHSFIIDQGNFTGSTLLGPVNESLSPPNDVLDGQGTGNGSLILTPAGTLGPYSLFNAVVTMPVEVIDRVSGANITATGTIKATGQIQIPASEFFAWMIAQGATSFDPNADTAGNGAPDGIKWALGLDLFDNPLPFLLKPHPTIPGTFTITLPPGGTVAPLTVESSTNLMPPWTTVPAGQLVPSFNPISAGSTGTISITPTTPNKLFLRMRANP